MFREVTYRDRYSDSEIEKEMDGILSNQAALGLMNWFDMHLIYGQANIRLSLTYMLWSHKSVMASQTNNHRNVCSTASSD